MSLERERLLGDMGQGDRHMVKTVTENKGPSWCWLHYRQAKCVKGGAKAPERQTGSSPPPSGL